MESQARPVRPTCRRHAGCPSAHIPLPTGQAGSNCATAVVVAQGAEQPHAVLAAAPQQHCLCERRSLVRAAAARDCHTAICTTVLERAGRLLLHRTATPSVCYVAPAPGHRQPAQEAAGSCEPKPPAKQPSGTAAAGDEAAA